MCPLRFILIFLSATLAGFFVLRNLRSQPHPTDLDQNDEGNTESSDSANSSSITATSKSKVRVALESGFWTLVDMASGRYLWRQLVPSSSKRSTHEHDG
uniref:Methyltransferase-related protein n=1 Tax=Lotus japonicus TaxID=34305 RepID=I3T9P9_LOTJA|nr:unknown [Lotus japonicus]